MGKPVERRLTTILAADVVGYSRLMGDDEVGTLGALKAHRKELIGPKEAQYNGRTFKLMGDGALTEFSSVVEAVQFAIDVQLAMRERNALIPGEKQIIYRIGINLGDVIVEDDDIYGDGVNVAARLEGLAAPGGICISRAARDQVRDRMDIQLEDLGEISVKNIARPVHCFTVTLDKTEDTMQKAEMSSDSAPPLPSKPSIAVLPFQNMSGDAEQEYFADGMAEDIITSLSRYRSLFVIARNSTFAYKGQSPDLRVVSRDLGVRYVLEGSVRKGGSRIRVTAQLIEGQTGNHIWAERYDRELDDIFSLQDEITETIVSAIGPEIDQVERERAQRLPPENLDAWALYQRGLWHLYRFNREDNIEAQRLFRDACDASPNFAPALSGLTHALYYAFMHGYAEDRTTLLQQAYETGRAAVAADERDADTHFALGRILYLRRDLDASTAEFEMAISQNQNFAQVHMGLGTALVYGGQFDRCIESCDLALRLSPNDPVQWTIQTVKGLALLCMGRIEDAVDALQQGTRQPTAAWTAHCVLASALANLDDTSRAQIAVDETLRIKPDLNATHLREIFAFRNPTHFDILIDGLRKAGFDI
jgi:adenylate cyclase